MEIRPPFQRHEVWTDAAKVMLMDSILRNIPMPKLFFQSIIKDSETHRIVIDGQQRIKAILSFLRGEFRLLKPYLGEYYGLFFNDLPIDAKDDFLSYKVDINEIVHPTEEMVREIYSRVNKYTVALNKQELRRADFPGQFLSLSEKLAVNEFFDESKLFSVASRRRMGDVEFTSELLAILLGGVQDKRDKLDEFYEEYAEWDTEGMKQIEFTFLNILNTITIIFNSKSIPIAQTRFRQRADFYSLFTAIHELLQAGGSVLNKDLNYLQEDIRLLDDEIEPESTRDPLMEYAIKCVSQGNTLASRRWRADFIKSIFSGTFFPDVPGEEARFLFHDIIEPIDYGMCPPPEDTCPICKQQITDFSKENAIVTWRKGELAFQISNSVFIHSACRDS
ncbi:MAG: GmrSD restriction endonuclease domain-containing protein [Bacilli bacterium]